MAIKIDNKDLSKRIINWQEVQKVILNWAEIRPNEVPHIDYHVISDFTSWWGGWGWWWLTWGWEWSWYSSSSASWIYSSNGSTVSIYYTWMPSLTNAKKIEVFHQVNWNQSYNVNYLALSWSFKNISSASIVNCVIRTEVRDSETYWYEWVTQIRASQWHKLTNTPIWNIVIKYWVDFTQITQSHPYWWFWVQTMSTDLSTTYDSNSWFLTEEASNFIKNSNYYQVNIWGDMKVKKVDFYIYNN